MAYGFYLDLALYVYNVCVCACLCVSVQVHLLDFCYQNSVCVSWDHLGLVVLLCKPLAQCHYLLLIDVPV